MNQIDELNASGQSQVPLSAQLAARDAALSKLELKAKGFEAAAKRIYSEMKSELDAAYVASRANHERAVELEAELSAAQAARKAIAAHIIDGSQLTWEERLVNSILNAVLFALPARASDALAPARLLDPITLPTLTREMADSIAPDPLTAAERRVVEASVAETEAERQFRRDNRPTPFVVTVSERNAAVDALLFERERAKE